MWSSLQNHPFAVEAHFKFSIVLTFAVPETEIRNLIPPCLELDTLQNECAFIAVAMVQTKDLRPKGFPRFFGNDFFLIGYRVFVRYKNPSGKIYRGLYILKSQTDKRKMELFGNIFTHYNYSTTDVNLIHKNDTLEINSVKEGFHVLIDNSGAESIPLPVHSPFQDFTEARKFAGPLPFTFTYDPKTRDILIIEGVRENWKPRPLYILSYRFPFLEQLNIKICLANAFIVENIPYFWKKGRNEKWQV